MLKWLYFGAAAVAGVAMAFQGTFNTVLTKAAGIWQSVFIVHAVGLAVTAVMLFFLKIGPAQFDKIISAPWYAFTGGLLNVVIIMAVMKAIGRIGVGNATTVIIVAQVLAALFIDHSGAFGMKKYPLHWPDFLGVVLLAAGVRILLIK
ncbi:MAG: DMT family transporter [Syntrophomonadaceae bacterium]|jgi:transporter family-2 protein|nr:DMT family transporter [Syntrophomonadaceae bacterium]